MTDPVSRRGVYYDLEKSPYEFTSSYGDLFKFRSRKKLDMFTRDIEKEIERFHKFISRNQLFTFVPVQIRDLVERQIYFALYHKIEGSNE